MILDKKMLIIDKEYLHRYRGKCVFTDACRMLEKQNPDKLSVFMDFEGDIFEVSIYLINEVKND